MQFSQQPGWYQAMIVAAYRTERQIEAVLSEHREMEYTQKQAAQKAAQLSQGPFR